MPKASPPAWSEGGAPLQALHAFVQRHPRLFVITGAGCSTAAGIPDYRDANGDWKRPQPVNYQAFMGDAATRRRYWARSLLGWPVMAGARPHPHPAFVQHPATRRLEDRASGHGVPR